MACEPCEPKRPRKTTPLFSRGAHTLSVAAELHKHNRERLRTLLTDAGAAGIALLRGGEAMLRNDTDHEEIFRQESYFHYLFGVKEPGWWGVIDLSSGMSTLFMPKLPSEYAVWMGRIHGPEHFRTMYSVDDVKYVCDLKEWIASIFRPLSSDDPQRIHIISGLNSDSGANLNASLPVVDMIEDTLYGKGSETSRVDESQLHQALAECRVRKSTAEIELMAYVSYISSLAHVAVMRDAKPGMFEYQLEAKFLFEVHYNFGARHHAYTPICACGPSGATLHYGHAGAPNDRQLGDDDMALLDMAAEYHCYASDITCSFPLSGSFSPDQRLVYEGVLGAQRAVLTAMRPGVSWLALHEVALRQILSALRKGGVLRRDASLDEMLAAELGATFMPHGLGHLIGIDTHDVGGYLPGTPARSERPGFRSCRTARILEEGMVLTVEPGCYFIDRLLDEALDSPKLSQFICADTLDRFRGKGGVRLEDVIVVTADGCSNLTQCPRTCSEVEAVMKGEQWPPTVDTEPWLRRRWAKFDPSSSRMIGFGGKHQLSPAQ